MNKEVPLFPALLSIAVVVGGALYWTLSQQTAVPVDTTVAPSVQPSASGTTTNAPAPTKATTPTKAPTQTASRDTLSAAVKSGVAPFTVPFTLTINTSPSCTSQGYVLVFGDSIEKNVETPKAQCSRPYTTIVYHQYTRPGSYTSALFTKLATGGKGVELAKVTITAKDQSVTSGSGPVTFTTSPIAGVAPLSVTFALSATDGSENTGVYYSIAYGTGVTEYFARKSTPTITHVFTEAGSYTVMVARRTQCSLGTCSGSSSPVGSITITVN